MATSSNTFLSATVTGVGPQDETAKPLLPLQDPDFLRADPDEYVDRLRRIDPSLAQTYEEVWEALYGTKADPERAALGLMRQTFDHLFDALAPDTQVRSSPYWTRKPEGDPDRVHRRERLLYAANTHVSDAAERATLISLTESALATYERLNVFHKRGTVDRAQARSALHTMKGILESWVDAMVR